MAYRATKSFVDSDDKQWYREGQVYKGKRPKELADAGFLKSDQEVLDAEGEVVDLESLTKAEIQHLLDDHYVKHNNNMTKVELVNLAKETIEG